MLLTFRMVPLAVTIHAVVCILGSSVVAQQAVENADRYRQQLDLFESKIRPVLIKHCYECHATDANEIQGGLLVDSRESIRSGGDSGAAVVPGKPDESLLLEAIRYESFEMPPSGQLPEQVIADFEKWIEEGAIDPRDSNSSTNSEGVDIQSARSHWSFQSIKNPAVPDVSNDTWPSNDVDRFILSQLQQRDLSPVSDANKTQLVRRIYFDLIGLPPSPTEIDQFLDDERPDAVERLIDQLLDSPHFGERWARHWLDVARYSDSSGGGRVLIFHDAWRYRDYVINAFNNDKPFDQFVREQVAGDLLPHEDFRQRGDQLTATGFLMLGPHNYELQDKELLRMEVVDEQIDVIGRAFLGLTLGCARCHDHKFDPVPTSDYYALAGIFRSTDSLVTANVSRFVETELPLPLDKQYDLDLYREALAYHEEVVKTLKAKLPELKKEDGYDKNVFVDKPNRQLRDNDRAQLTGQWQASSNVEPFVGANYQYTSQKSAKAVYDFELADANDYELLLSYTPHPNRTARAPVHVNINGEVKEFRINQKEPPARDGLFYRVDRFKLPTDSKITVTISGAADGVTVIDSVKVIKELSRPPRRKAQVNKWGYYSYLEAIELIRTHEQVIAKKKKSPPATPAKVMSVREHRDTSDYFVCVRGDAHRLGDPVPRRALQIIPIDHRLDIGERASGRRELAEWLVDPGNPLPARVYVNRVWTHLFGDGLVRTTDNFGLVGQKPSHPELLDYLSIQFIENGWSTKWLIRQLVNSHAYRLATIDDERNANVDPENRLLWRANRRRLDVESIRDSILSFSSQLETQVGGPSIDRKLSREFGYEYRSKRRTVYLPIFRNTLHDMLDVFDFPNPNLVSGNRSESTLPAQALYLMNSPFVIDQARAAAERILALDLDSNKKRLEWAYRSALGRPPTEIETVFMMEFLAKSSLDNQDGRIAAWSDICQTLVASLDFRYLD